VPEDIKTADALSRNRAYYEDAESSSPGQLDYWQKMAAPRARVGRTLGVLQDRAPGSVLDIGCGGGQLLREIQARLPGIRAAGCDLAVDRIEANRRLMPNLTWFSGDVQDPAVLGAVTAPFDALVALELVEHLDDPAAFLRNALPAVSKEGFIFLSTQSGPVRATEQHVGHVQHFSSAQMETLLADCGWRPIRVWNEGFPFHDLSKWYANRDPEKTLAQFSDRPYGAVENGICFVLRQAFRLNSRRHGAQLYACAVKATR
jgi:2-polyprenyl-3-methyl-5-hydroxy-6-metoxy-1,4-benzoquinol methylase